MLFAGNQNVDWKTEQATEEIPCGMDRLHVRCPYSGRGDQSRSGAHEWVSSRDLRECSRVPCGCVVAEMKQKQSCSATRLPSTQEQDSNPPIGGARLVADIATIVLMGGRRLPVPKWLMRGSVESSKRNPC